MTYLFMIGVYVIVVEKARNILDFVLTTFFIHIILCCFISGFPNKFLWWFFHGILLTAVTLISEFIALKLEQQDIKIDIPLGKKVKVNDSEMALNNEKQL